jgi:hypothetical protein
MAQVERNESACVAPELETVCSLLPGIAGANHYTGE